MSVSPQSISAEMYPVDVLKMSHVTPVSHSVGEYIARKISRHGGCSNGRDAYNSLQLKLMVTLMHINGVWCVDEITEVGKKSKATNEDVSKDRSNLVVN